MALIILGVVVFFISFTNVEMITGLWVAGDIKKRQAVYGSRTIQEKDLPDSPDSRDNSFRIRYSIITAK